MRQCPGRNEVHPGLGDRPRGGQCHTATRFGLGTASAFFHRQAQSVRVHVVKQHLVSARSDRLLHLFQRISFDFHLERRIFLPGALDRRSDGVGRSAP